MTPIYPIEPWPLPAGLAAERNARVLGKAVHPRALLRLHELWPHARVFVRHTWMQPSPGETFPWDERDRRGRGRRVTAVAIVQDGEPDALQFVGFAVKHPNDRWDRKRGIRLAFDRALRAVSATQIEGP
jgi:hypothetical protein